MFVPELNYLGRQQLDNAPRAQEMHRPLDRMSNLKIVDFNVIEDAKEYGTDVSSDESDDGTVEVRRPLITMSANSTERHEAIKDLVIYGVKFTDINSLPGRFTRSELGIIIWHVYQEFKQAETKKDKDALTTSLLNLHEQVRLKDRELFYLNVKLMDTSATPSRIPGILKKVKHSKRMLIPIKAAFFFYGDNEAMLEHLFKFAKERGYLISTNYNDAIGRGMCPALVCGTGIGSGVILGACLTAYVASGGFLIFACALGGACLSSCTYASYSIMNQKYVYTWSA